MMSACTDLLDDHFSSMVLIEPAYLLESASEGHVLNVYDGIDLIHSIDVFSSHSCTIDTAISTPTQDIGLLLLVQDGSGEYVTARYSAGAVGLSQSVDQDLAVYITQASANCLLSDDGTQLVFVNQNFE